MWCRYRCILPAMLFYCRVKKNYGEMCFKRSQRNQPIRIVGYRRQHALRVCKELTLGAALKDTVEVSSPCCSRQLRVCDCPHFLVSVRLVRFTNSRSL